MAGRTLWMVDGNGRGNYPSFPEKPTLAERFILALRLPYPVGCLLIAFLLGPSLGIFFAYLLTLDLSTAYENWLRNVLAFGLTGYIGYLATIAYAFYAPRYVRRKLLKIEGALSALLPNEQSDFHSFFGGISAKRWQVIAWALLFVGNSAFMVRVYPEVTTAFSLVETLIVVPIVSLGTSATILVLLGSLRGIYKMGLAPLQLKAYQVDPHLGVRPVGSLALSLSFVYFGGALINGFNNITRTSDIIYLSILLPFIGLGLLMFFLPMLQFHKVMTKLRQQEKQRLELKLHEVHADPGNTIQPQPNIDALFLDMMERKVASISTWPFDTKILGTLFAVVSTVLGILLSLLSLR